MNIQETRNILAILWSYYPNAPKLDDSAAALMALSWARMFAEFSKLDVMNALQKAVKMSPKFVPTAPEILAHCTKTLETTITQEEFNTNMFLLNHARELSEKSHEEALRICAMYTKAIDAYSKIERGKWEDELKSWMKPALEAK